MKIVVRCLIGLLACPLAGMEPNELTEHERTVVSYMQACMRGTLEAEAGLYTFVSFFDSENPNCRYTVPLALMEAYMYKRASENPVFKKVDELYNSFCTDKKSEELREALKNADIFQINQASIDLYNARLAKSCKVCKAAALKKKIAAPADSDSCVIL